MSDLEYKEKYLKYKNKYLTLKSKLDTQNSIQNDTQPLTQAQSGGNYFYRGTYVFFLNKYQTNSEPINKIINSRIIDNFDNFTNLLGNCAYFLRVGSTTTGYDVNHDFDTIYPNKSSAGAIASSISLSASNLGDKILQGFGNIFSKKSNKSPNFQNSEVSKPEDPEVSNAVGGGEHIPFEIKYLCYYEPIRLSSIEFESNFKGFKYTSDIENQVNLKKLIDGINSKIVSKSKNLGNEISTVLVINKLANTNNDAETVRRYDINYSDSTYTIIEHKY